MKKKRKKKKRIRERERERVGLDEKGTRGRRVGSVEKRLWRLPLRQSARTCTQNKHHSAIHSASGFEHSSPDDSCVTVCGQGPKGRRQEGERGVE